MLSLLAVTTPAKLAWVAGPLCWRLPSSAEVRFASELTGARTLMPTAGSFLAWIAHQGAASAEHVAARDRVQMDDEPLT